MPQPAAAPILFTPSPFWYGVGRQSAATYLIRSEWLYRRVESIEFVGRYSVRRRVSVDFEIPSGLPSLGTRARPDGRLVPVAALQKWPPLTGFDFIGPDEHPISLYMRDTTKALDLGLLVGLAESVIGRISPAMADGFTYIVSHETPDERELAAVVHGIRIELEHAVEDITDPGEREQASQRMKETIDFAGRLSNSSLLWVLVTGTPGTDWIVKFSYLDPHVDTNRPWKRVLIGCSWWQRTIDLWLPHAGLHTRYHLDVLPPAPGLVLKSASLVALRGPRGAGASTARPATGQDARPEYSRIRDGRAIIYRGAREAPSHRIFLRVRIAASREGFISGCAISAAVVAALMTASFIWLPAANRNIDATVVLLGAVPVVLGYVLVRPGETAFERYHLVGVRRMTVISGSLPIVGAITLVLTRNGDTSLPGSAKDVWAILVIASLLLAVALAMSWFHAVNPDAGEQIIAPRQPRTWRLIAPRSAIIFAVGVLTGSLLESQPYSHVGHAALAVYLAHHKLRVLSAIVITGAGVLALYGFLVGAWQGLVPRDSTRRARRLFRCLVVYPGVAWIWVTMALLSLTVWLTITISHSTKGDQLAWFSPAIDVVANATLGPAAIVVLSVTAWLAWRVELLRDPRDAGLVLVGEAGYAALVLIGARAVSVLSPADAHVSPGVAWVGLAAWVAIAGTIPRLARHAPD